MADSDPISPLLQALKDLAAWLEDQQVRGAVIGGVAASLLGRPRATRDVDAVILLDSTKLEAFLAAGRQFGFSPRLSDAIPFAQRNRVLLATHEPSKTQVDLSLGILPFEEETVARATIISISDVSFPVVTPEDLIIMKAIARRPRDMADIESVLDAHPNIDTDRIRYWVGQFAQVLESPEILSDLDAMLSRHQ
ncbi:MAG TPA: nucleotidyl transferase AbiEii/AbiGii toxin family protein [Blastocatellia bacterium]|nr:nucleotidyl transferase AbiEii/AbiGii toxin family protein [Blastocatellia bacterium]